MKMQRARRRFLRSLLSLGGLASVAHIPRASLGEEDRGARRATEERPQPRPGYRVTEHIEKYYEKARF